MITRVTIKGLAFRPLNFRFNAYHAAIRAERKPTEAKP